MGPANDILLLGGTCQNQNASIIWSRGAVVAQADFGVGPFDPTKGDCLGYDRVTSKIVNFKCGDKLRVLCE
jgi:hypothetical protein